MTTLFVQYTDSSEQVISSYFTCAQDPAVWSNQGTVDTSDARWKAYVGSLTGNAASLMPAPTST